MAKDQDKKPTTGNAPAGGEAAKKERKRTANPIRAHGDIQLLAQIDRYAKSKCPDLAKLARVYGYLAGLYEAPEPSPADLTDALKGATGQSTSSAGGATGQT